MAALAARGGRVAAAKVGPDFIDPGYHALATGRPGRNLDAWLSGTDAIGPLAGRAAAGADVLVVEGVMGLFDGASDGTPSSTADVARLLDAPVVLVVDAAAMSQSVAAVVHGFAHLARRRRAASPASSSTGSPATATRRCCATRWPPLGLPVLGALRRDDALDLAGPPPRSGAGGRAPGCRPRRPRPAGRRGRPPVRPRRRRAPGRHRAPRSPWPTRPAAAPVAGRPRLALAAGPAFTFTYRDNVEALEAAGAELVPFDPLADAALPPAVDGLVVGGGFPEVYGEALAANEPLLADVRRRVGGGLPTWAECGGLLWLSRSLDGRPDGRRAGRRRHR